MKHLGGGQRFISRISALGFVADAEVEIVRSLSQRSIIVAVRGTQIALGYGEAAKVHVQVTTAEGKPAAPHGTLRVALAGRAERGQDHGVQFADRARAACRQLARENRRGREPADSSGIREHDDAISWICPARTV